MIDQTRRKVLKTAATGIAGTTVTQTTVDKGSSRRVENSESNKSNRLSFNSIEWKQTFGGSSGDKALSIIQTYNNNYVFAGDTFSSGEGLNDAWIVKIDQSGELQWEQTYGKNGFDAAFSIVETDDKGYLFAGQTQPSSSRSRDAWLVKITEKGEKQWDQTYGGNLFDSVNSVINTSDGGYLFTGRTESAGDGFSDAWLVKTDNKGNSQWKQTYGGAGDDYGKSVVETAKNNFLFVGSTASKAANRTDAWILKIDRNGKRQWEQTYGESERDIARSVLQANDNGYLVSGRTESTDGTGFDAWLLKTTKTGELQWQQTYGAAKYESAEAIIKDGSGYLFAGRKQSTNSTNEDYNAWLVKVNKNGHVVWEQTYTQQLINTASSVVRTNDGKYVFAGYTDTSSGNDRNACIVKINKTNITTQTPTETERPDSPTSKPITTSETTQITQTSLVDTSTATNQNTNSSQPETSITSTSGPGFSVFLGLASLLGGSLIRSSCSTGIFEEPPNK